MHQLLFILTAFSLFAEIIEAPRFADLESCATTDALFIVDIDDTLLIPVQTLGTDVWFEHQWRQNQAEAIGDPLDKALALWEAIRHLTKVQIVESGSDQIVAKMQGQGIPIMGLTTQGLALATRTVNQLRSLHFDLSRTAPSQEDCYFQNGKGVLYRNGILFTSGTDKGAALVRFLDLIGYLPQRVVFINDKQKHLQNVEEALKKRGVLFTGLRYSFSDERIASFRPEIAEIQLRYSSFGRILSDAEAEKILLESTAEAAYGSD